MFPANTALQRVQLAVYNTFNPVSVTMLAKRCTVQRPAIACRPLPIRTMRHMVQARAAAAEVEQMDMKVVVFSAQQVRSERSTPLLESGPRIRALCLTEAAWTMIAPLGRAHALERALSLGQRGCGPASARHASLLFDLLCEHVSCHATLPAVCEGLPG